MARVAELQAETQQALEAAIAAQTLPRAARAQAGTLLDRLQTATRVTLVGRPGSGKSALVNLLAGQDVLPLGLALCTVQLVYGAEKRAIVTLRDGSNLTMDGDADLRQIAAMNPVFLKFEAPLPALTKISVLEVVTSDDRVEQIRALAWAAKQTDIAIWCTETYDAAEQTLWADVPDAIKDHAILVRTRADALGGGREQAVAELTRDAGPDFAHVMAVSAKDAQIARSNPGGVDKAGMKSSGAMALISTILRQIESGRQFAVDQAEILLRKHKDYTPKPDVTELVPDTTKVTAKPKTAEPAPVEMPETVEVPVVETVEEVLVDAAPEIETDVEPVPEPSLDAVMDSAIAEAVEASKQDDAILDAVQQAADVEPEIESPAEPVVDVVDDLPDDMTDALRAVCEQATGRLQKTGADLATMEDASPKAILNRAAEDIVWLSEHLEDAGHSSNTQFKQLNTWVRDAEDLIQLLRIEGGDDSATDAVTTLLQLKRGFQAQLAA